MKTSLKLLILGMLILLGATAAIDFAYQRIYRSGDYDNPYASYETMKFRDFDSIEIVAANLIRTRIKRGDKFDVKLHKWAQNAKIEQKGSRLIVTFHANTVGYMGNYEDALLIECPTLKRIVTDARFLINGKPVIAKGRDLSNYQGGRTYIEGFQQDSLSVIVNNYNELYLYGNQLSFLSANLGSSDSSRSTIFIDKSNKIQSADFDVQHNSVMKLNDVFIKNFKYKLSDSAQVNLSGISLRLLSNK